MNSFYLKIFAMVTMLIDHTGAILFPNLIIFRMIGRLAFPIYCFLLVEGYSHTSNLKKYMIRLLLFAFISEMPFDLAFHNTRFYLNYQNVFFTLFIGLLAVHCYNFFKENKLKQISSIVLLCLISELIMCDYGIIGVLMILGFYIFKNNKKSLVIFEAILTLPIPLEPIALLSFIPIFSYNKKRGYTIKYLFYSFYPLHLFILYICKCYIMKR